MASALSAFSGTASFAASHCYRRSTALLARSTIIRRIALLPSPSSLIGGVSSRVQAAYYLGLRMASMPTDRAEIETAADDDAPSMSEGGGGAAVDEGVAKAGGPRDKVKPCSLTMPPGLLLPSLLPQRPADCVCFTY